eukprot:10381059-Prorocentrum_lima.AAC.1
MQDVHRADKVVSKLLELVVNKLLLPTQEARARTAFRSCATTSGRSLQGWLLPAGVAQRFVRRCVGTGLP